MLAPRVKESGAHPHGPSGAILALISSSDFYLFIFGVRSSGTSLLQTCSLGRVIYSLAFGCAEGPLLVPIRKTTRLVAHLVITKTFQWCRCNREGWLRYLI